MVDEQSNILITDDLTACLTDFGRSRIVNDSSTTNPAITNTIRYTAPEILSQDESDDDKPRLDLQAADVYSLAMVVLEVKLVVFCSKMEPKLTHSPIDFDG